MSACYFAYGSNMNPERVRERGILFRAAEGASLTGYRLLFDKTSTAHPGSGHANVVYAPGSKVEGVLYWLDTPDQIEKMDRFESAPVNYSREVVAVSLSGDDRQVWTWIYFANPAVRRTGLKPPRSYLAHLLAGRPYLSAAYYDYLAGHPCEETP